MTKLIAGFRGYHPHLPIVETETQKVTGLPGTSQPGVTQLGGADQRRECEQLCSRALAVSQCAILCPCRQSQKCLGISTQISFMEKSREIRRTMFTFSKTHAFLFPTLLFILSHSVNWRVKNAPKPEALWNFLSFSSNIFFLFFGSENHLDKSFPSSSSDDWLPVPSLQPPLQVVTFLLGLINHKQKA